LAGVPAALFAGASGALTAGAAAFAAAEADFAGCLESDLEADAAGFSADALATATFTGTDAGATFAATAGAEALAGAVFTAGGALFFATLGAAPSECNVRISFPADPGVNSYANGFSRSTTTLVVGGVLPSIPMRTPFTPALPTGILLCALATTVSGSSTNKRAGELSLVTRGVTAWLELISIWTPSAPGTTLTFWSWLFAEDVDAGFAAATGLDPGIAAGFTAGAGAPGAGLGAGLACCCCSDFAVLRALSMASGFCAAAAAQLPPTIIAVAKMPVVNLNVNWIVSFFIVIPTSPPAFPVSSRRLPLKVSNRD